MADFDRLAYVLGWMLAGIGQNPRTRNTWVFKDGTCLKKAYFETYRFSEDLDFTLLDGAHVNEVFLREVLRAKCEFKGIAVPTFELLCASPHHNELRADWGQMLEHQLPVTCSTTSVGRVSATFLPTGARRRRQRT